MATLTSSTRSSSGAKTGAAASFFSSLLAPSLLSFSPLQSILASLKDAELVRFCRVNKEHHAILPKMRLNEYHTLTSENWTLIQQRQGPIIHSINLVDLSELKSIPQSQRDSITRIIIDKLSGTSPGPVSRDLLPSRLTSLHTRLWKQQLITGDELPILPATMKTLVIGFQFEADATEDTAVSIFGAFQTTGAESMQKEKEKDEKSEMATAMMKRALSEVTNLTHLGMSVHNISALWILPQTIETLELHMCSNAMPTSNSDWPDSLKHLTIKLCDTKIRIAPLISLPKSLVSLTFPHLDYDHYETTMPLVSTIDSLRTINFGHGIKNLKGDLFALLPRFTTEITLNASWIWHTGVGFYDRCEAARVDSLLDTIEIIKWELNDLPVTRWPSSLRVLHIFGQEFTRDINGLPDSVEDLILPLKYVGSVARWPKSLKKVNVGSAFNCLASIERQPPSVLDLSAPLSIVRRMMLSGTILTTFPRLTGLSLFNEPDWSHPLDLSLLPKSLIDLRFNGAVALIMDKD